MNALWRLHERGCLEVNRLGFAAIVVFYGLNGWRLQLPHEDATVDLVLGVAKGEAKGEVELHRIAATLESWAQRRS